MLQAAIAASEAASILNVPRGKEQGARADQQRKREASTVEIVDDDSDEQLRYECVTVYKCALLNASDCECK